MRSTKTEILALLKRSDGATVDDLTSALGLASMTVRQHLTALERDALVRSEEVRRPTGRPHFRYSLTDNGHRSMAEGHDRLVALLVEQAGGLDPIGLAGASADERRRTLFRLAAESLAGRYREQFQFGESEGIATAIVSILREYGGFAEWHHHDEGIEIRDFSCVFRSTVGRDGICEWHETFLRSVLGRPVRVAPPPATGCADCCGYIIAMTVDAAVGIEKEHA